MANMEKMQENYEAEKQNLNTTDRDTQSERGRF